MLLASRAIIYWERLRSCRLSEPPFYSKELESSSSFPAGFVPPSKIIDCESKIRVLSPSSYIMLR